MSWEQVGGQRGHQCGRSLKQSWYLSKKHSWYLSIKLKWYIINASIKQCWYVIQASHIYNIYVKSQKTEPRHNWADVPRDGHTFLVCKRLNVVKGMPNMRYATCRPQYGRWTTCISNLRPQIMFSLHRKQFLPERMMSWSKTWWSLFTQKDVIVLQRNWSQAKLCHGLEVVYSMKHFVPLQEILMLLLFSQLTFLQLLIKIIIRVTVITMVRAGLISQRGQLGLICVPPAL